MTISKYKALIIMQCIRNVLSLGRTGHKFTCKIPTKVGLTNNRNMNQIIQKASLTTYLKY